MIASRISVAFFALALTASGAFAQSDDDRATAPPRQLGERDQPPDVSTRDLKDDNAPDQAPEDQPTAVPPPRAHASRPGDVSTEDLADDNEDQPPPSKARPHNTTVETAPLDSPPPSTGPIVPKSQSVEVGTLGTISEGASGVVDASNGGLEQNIWTGSKREQVDDLLAKAPLSSPDSAVHALARRAILTKADAPVGQGHRAFATLRIQKLLDAGMVDEAGALAAQAQVKDDPDFARVQANALLLAGRSKDVCGPDTASRTSQGDRFWLELRAYCAATSGDSATADLTRDVMAAQGATDVAYNVLITDILTGAKKPVDKIAKPTALHVFLLRKAGLPINADIAKQLGPSVDVLILRDPKLLPEQRLAAAERAMHEGAVSASELKAVADAQVVTADQTATALTAAPKLSFLRAQALLRRAAQIETRPAEKAKLIHEALTLGDKAGLFEIASDIQADVAVSIDAKNVAQSQGPLIGWSLLLAGKTASAAPWLGDNDIARSVMGLATGKDDTAQSALSDIATRLPTEVDKAANASRPMEVLLLGLYDALGRTLPADAKAEASAIRAQHLAGRRPDDAAMQVMLLAAATPERKGEAVLRILDIVGAKGPGDLAPDITIEIVRALQAMNLKDSARGFAIHALMLYRPGTS